MPNARFTKAIKTFQAGNDLKVDGLIRSGGPTIHALGLKTMGPENGRPSGFDASDFKAATGRDPNRFLSGRAIFETLGEGGGSGTPRTQEAAAIQLLPSLPAGSGDGEPLVVPPIPPVLPLPQLFPNSKIPRILRTTPEWFKRIERWVKDLPPIIEPGERKPVIGKTPAHIFKYADGRVYLSVNELGKIDLHRGKPGPIQFEEIEHKVVADSIIKTSQHPYPTLDDRRSFREREAAGQDGYVYGPVREKNGTISHVPLVDPSSRSFLGGTAKLLRVPIKNGIFLTLAQIKAMGLSKWHVTDKAP